MITNLGFLILGVLAGSSATLIAVALGNASKTRYQEYQANQMVDDYLDLMHSTDWGQHDEK